MHAANFGGSGRPRSQQSSSVLQMLQTNMPQNDRSGGWLDGMPREQAEEAGAGEFINFAVGFLRRQYVVIVFVAALALAAGATYLRVTPPTYKGQVKVLFNNP